MGRSGLLDSMQVVCVVGLGSIPLGVPKTMGV